MPADKKGSSSSGKSAQQTITDFIGTFSVTTSSHPFGISFSSNMSPVEESDIANSDKRSAHNALERQRREGLNTKYQQLAHALPSLQTVRRPSKTTIITKSLEYVSTSVQRETVFQKQLRILKEENEKLKKQAHRSSAFLKKKLHLESTQTKKSVENMPTSSLMSGKSTGSKKISSPVSPTPSSRVIKKKSSRSFLKRFTSKLHPQTRPKHKVKFEQVKKSPEIQLQEQANEMTLADMTAMTALLPTQTPSSSPSYFSSSTISPLPPQPLPPLFDAPYSSAHSSYPLSVIPTLMPQLDTLSPLEQVWSTENALGQNQYALDQFNMLTDPYFMDSQMAQSICGAGLHMPTHIPLQIPSNQYTGALDYNTESYYYYGVPSTDPLFNMSLQVPSSEVSIMPTSIEQEDISPIFMHNMTGHDYTYN